MTTLQPISPVTCPCCGQHVERPDWATFRQTLDLGPKESRMLACLAESFGRFVMRADLVTGIWGGQIDGGPENPRKHITAWKSAINRKLAGSSFVVEGGRGIYGGWRLTWRERSA